MGCGLVPDLDGDTDSESGGTAGTDEPTATAGMDEGSGTDMPIDVGMDSDSDSGGEATERAVDIVFIVDNSGSMSEEQAKLAQSIGTLVSALDAAVPPVDYRIAVTTTDSGNPWCSETTSPESGTFRATSCRERTGEFVFNGAMMINSIDEACFAVCEQDQLGLTEPWIDVSRSTGTTNVPGDDVVSALSCMLPQGINGCGFEQPLESLSLALARAQTPGELNEGFLRPGALLAVALVTDEVDCSYNPEYQTIFLPEGNRVFWSDPDSPAPSSAVCWNAGVQCTGAGGTYDDCTAVDLDVDGDPVAGDPDQDAVLRPIAGYIEELSSRGAFMMAINGVAADGSPVYADSPTDPDFQGDFGIGPGCNAPSGSAVPPVRVREVVEAVTGPGNLYSVCDDDFSPALTSLAQGIVLRLPAE
ncbi:MAG: vWA domain-containing protein [Nannocystaceae bacterium]